MSHHLYTDDAPFGVPAGVAVHDMITVTPAVKTLGTATGSAGIPTYTDESHEVRWPRAVYLGTLNTTANVWVTWSSQTPAVNVLGVKVPPTYPSLRIPAPGIIRADGIKIITDSVGGEDVIVVWEF